MAQREADPQRPNDGFLHWRQHAQIASSKR